MSRLTALHRGLDRVRRFRSMVRMGSALSMCACVILWVLIGAYVLDVTLHMGRLERSIMFLIFVGAMVWSVRQFVLPAMRVREDMMQLALMVERQQGIHSDLVAALQFADSSKSQFGSTDLREAVIDVTDEVSTGLNYLDGFSRRELNQRATMLAVTVFVALIPLAAYAQHASVFFQRFLLSNAKYPTATIIEAIESPGAKAAYGQPVRFRLKLAGELPEDKIGRVELTALSSGLETTVELKPNQNNPFIYEGELTRALDDLSYQIFIGDAYTDLTKLELIPLPVIDVELKIEIPAYARGRFKPTLGGGRQRVALEGSRVVPIVTADKDLKSATIRLGEQTLTMRRDGDKFLLDETDEKKNPLAAVLNTTRYEVQVVDGDDLTLERPVSGVLQVRADQPPRMAAATASRYVLPNASPNIRYGAVDDYGLVSVEVVISVTRQTLEMDGGSSGSEIVTPNLVPKDDENNSKLPNEIRRLIVKPENHGRDAHDDVKVSFADLGLEKGDRVTMTFVATDYRGTFPGKTTRSERIVFEVTDLEGVRAALRELDAEMDKKLDQIIKAQLGIGN